MASSCTPALRTACIKPAREPCVVMPSVMTYGVVAGIIPASSSMSLCTWSCASCTFHFIYMSLSRLFIRVLTFVAANAGNTSSHGLRVNTTYRARAWNTHSSHDVAWTKLNVAVSDRVLPRNQCTRMQQTWWCKHMLSNNSRSPHARPGPSLILPPFAQSSACSALSSKQFLLKSCSQI